MKQVIRRLCPPIIWDAAVRTRRVMASRVQSTIRDQQDLSIYWDDEMAGILDHWGKGTAWAEIEMLMIARSGKTLDIACGTGAVMKRLAKFTELRVYGCDISDVLLSKAILNGVGSERLMLCDATQMSYSDLDFDFSYSIGSLEHFTLEGLTKVISEAARVTKTASFHMVPTSRSGRDEGWLKTYQSMHNCSVDWWQHRFGGAFREVYVMESSWNDNISVGKWFLCLK